jgi:lipopolysaccharide transport system ATP-binding protein
MSDLSIKIENLSKQYRLGLIGTGTLSHDLNRWWHLMRGKEDPYLKVSESNDRETSSSSEYVWALKDISLEIKKGEILGVIGRNGAGKSTLLKILSRVTGPTKGMINIRGRLASLLEVGTGFHPELTGRENIFLNGAILGMTKKEIYGKLDEIVDFAGVTKYVDTPVKRYSSGMMVRLGFAVAAYLEPDILVVDEVLAVGDAEFQKKAIGKMQEVSQESGRTILFVSHNMAAVSSLCTNAVVIDQGSISHRGTTKDCIEFYLESSYKSKGGGIIPLTFPRKGSGDIRLAEISFYGKSGEIVFSGGKFVISLRFERFKKINPKDFRIDISINNNMGYRMIWLSSSLMRSYKVDEKGWVKFIVPCCPFIAGSYVITVFTQYKNQTCEWLQNVTSFDVHEADFYNTGKLPPSFATELLIDFEME